MTTLRFIPLLCFLKPISFTEEYDTRLESVFVNVYGAQKSILPGWESIPRLLKRFANTGSVACGIRV